MVEMNEMKLYNDDKLLSLARAPLISLSYIIPMSRDACDMEVR